MAHIKGEPLEVAMPNFNPDQSVLELIYDQLVANEDATAMIEADTGVKTSYAELLQYSKSLAAGLQKVGVTAGDLVVLCCDTSVLSLSLVLGIMFTGATVVFIDQQDTKTMEKVFKEKPVKAAFYAVKAEDLVRKYASTTNPPPLLVGAADWNSPEISSINLTDHSEFSVFKVQDPLRHMPLVLLSSGTTGPPKMTPITNLALQSFAWSNDMDGVQRFLLSTSIRYSITTRFLLKSIFNKFTLIIEDIEAPKVMLALIEKYQVDSILVNPRLLVDCVLESTNQQFHTETVELVMVVGDTLSSNQVGLFMRSSLYTSKQEIFHFYGSTENDVMSSLYLPKQFNDVKTGCCGKPLPGVEIKIVDEDYKTLSVGELGLVVAKTIIRTPGYWDSPELNQKVFLEDGFTMTGDVGRIDDEGQLFVLGRACDLIRYRGFKVAPLEVEDVLLSHPEVQEAVVVGLDHPTDTHHAKGFVVPVPGHTISTQDLENYVNARVEEPMKIRAGIQFLEKIPRNGPKPKRYLLKQL